jgi:hypothetical protein
MFFYKKNGESTNLLFFCHKAIPPFVKIKNLMKRLLFIILIFPSMIWGQSFVLVEKVDYKEDLPKISEKIPASVRKFIDPERMMAGSLEAFSEAHIGYYNNGIRFATYFMPIWGDHGNGFNDILGETTENYAEDFMSLQNSFFQNKDFWEPVYQMAIPHYKKQFAQMPVPAAKQVLNKLEEALTYAKAFDLEKEKADEAALKAKNRGFDYKKGKFRAFIYRRIRSQQMSKEEVVKWLERIIKDLQSAMPQQKEEVDDYVIYKGIFYGENEYFWGYKYEVSADLNSRKHMIFKKEGDSYKAIADLEDVFDYNKTNPLGNRLHVNLERANGKKELFLFSRDAERGKTLLDIFGLEKPVEKVEELKQWNAIIMSSSDGSMEIVYNFHKGTFDRYAIKEKPTLLRRYDRMGRWFLVSDNGKGELLRFMKKGKELEIAVEQKLPEGTNSIELVNSSYDPYLEDPWGDWGEPQSSEYLFVLKNQQQAYLWHLIEENSEWKKVALKNIDFDRMGFLTKDKYLIISDGKYGVINKDGRLLIEMKYLDIQAIKDNFIVVDHPKKPKAAFFDAQGNALTPFKFDAPFVTTFDPSTFEEKRGPQFEVNGSAGTVTFYQQKGSGEASTLSPMVYNHEGKEIIPPDYEYFSEVYTDKVTGVSYYMLSKKLDGDFNPELEELPAGKFGVVNSLGKKVIPQKYKFMRFQGTDVVFDPETFEEMLIEVEPHFVATTKKGKIFYLNLEGKKIKNPLEDKEAAKVEDSGWD